MFEIKVWSGPLGEALLLASAASGGFRLYLVCGSISPISVTVFTCPPPLCLLPSIIRTLGIIIDCWLISSQDP